MFSWGTWEYPELVHEENQALNQPTEELELARLTSLLGLSLAIEQYLSHAF